MPILIINQSKTKINKKLIEKSYSEIIKSLKKQKVKKLASLKKELTLLFVDKKQIQDLNKSFRGKNKPTDVLSFDAITINQLGEVVICVPIAKTQAKVNKHTLNDEITYLLLHGILHCLGYDHESKNVSESQVKKMFKIQDKVFAEFQ